MDIAVVVQSQVASTRAGVMFTIDPAAGRDGQARDRGLVRAGRSRRVGLGVTRPLRGRQGDAHVLAREVRHKELVIEGVARRRHRHARDAPADEADAPDLSDGEVRELAELGRRIESTTAPRRTPSGRSTRTATCGCSSRDPSRASAAGGTRRRRPAADGRVLLRGLGAAPGRASGRARVVATLAESRRPRRAARSS